MGLVKQIFKGQAMTLRAKTLVFVSLTLVVLLVILVAISQGIFLHRGQTNLLYFTIALFVIGLAVGLVVLLLMEKLVLSPLSRLSSSVVGIGTRGDPSARIVLTGDDELSRLGSEINGMLEALQKTHKAQRESEEKFKLLVEEMNDGYFLVQDFKVVYANARSAEMLGYSLDEVYDKSVGQLTMLQGLKELSERHTKRLLGEDVPQQYEMTLWRKDGTECIVEFSARLIDYAGKPAVSIVMRDINERRKAEKALRESEEQYSALVGSLTDAVFKIKGREIDWCNDRVSEIYGYTKEELTGQKASLLFPIDVNAWEFVGEVSAAIRERGFFRGTAKVKSKDGSVVDIEYAISQIHGREPVELVAVARDIRERRLAEEALQRAHNELEIRVQQRTSELVKANEKLALEIDARRQAEDALRYSEEYLRVLMENALDVILVLNADATIRYKSASFDYMIGDPRAGKSPLEFVHPDDLQYAVENLGQVISKPGAVVQGEIRGQHRDGSWRTFEIMARNLLDHPVVKGILVNFHDVTEHKRLEQERARAKALQESEKKLKRLIEEMDDGYCVIQDYKIAFVNSRGAEMFGYKPEEVTGKIIQELLPSKMAQELAEVYAGAERSGALPSKHQITLMRRDGTPCPIELGARFTEYAGRPAISFVIRDITERKQAEEKLKQLMAELTRSNTELEQFAYVASHDLQEPLRMVASYTQMLARRYKGKLDADADEFINYAVGGATRMQQLINALLDYSRVGTRGKSFELTDCEDVLYRAVTNLQVAIEENGAVVTHDPLPTVKADATQMVQLFQNLVGNSIKFHGDKRPEVYVGAKRNGTEWIFSVRDNGIGIDPKYFERIFVIFQRLHGREEYPGTGIGLTICKKIVERHKGRIWVESQPGEGATFHFTIPTGGENS